MDQNIQSLLRLLQYGDDYTVINQKTLLHLYTRVDS
jgi:hypothetical protein